MSRIGLTTGGWTIAGYMFVFGVGLGLVMQILVVAVQNAVPYEQLGTATSGAMFFRSIGGCFGTAVFGAVFSNLLVGNVVHALHLTSVPSNSEELSRRGGSRRRSSHLPPVIHAGVVSGLVHTIQTVFLIADSDSGRWRSLFVVAPGDRAAPDGAQRSTPARDSGCRRVDTSLEEIQLALESACATGEPRGAVHDARCTGRPGARTSVLLAALQVGGSARLHRREHRQPSEGRPGRIEQGMDALVGAGSCRRIDVPGGCELALTQLGDDAIDRLSCGPSRGVDGAARRLGSRCPPGDRRHGSPVGTRASRRRRQDARRCHGSHAG